MPRTPEFVRWTLSLPCALREDTDTANPEQTERQLRSLRSYSDAVHEGRLFEGICVAADSDPPTMGFPAAEVLGAYGGETFVRAQCESCPVNVVRGRAHSALAGCFGMLEIGAERGRAWDAAIERCGLADTIDTLFLPTRPRWYGLWLSSPLSSEQRAALVQLLAALNDAAQPEEQEFRRALELAGERDYPLHLQLFPAGAYDEVAWRVDAHCPRCKAPMDERERRCAVCDLACRAERARQRKVRGQRPYVALERFLGMEGAQAFSSRYTNAKQHQPEA
jgi:hypothetical protein